MDIELGTNLIDTEKIVRVTFKSLLDGLAIIVEQNEGKNYKNNSKTINIVNVVLGMTHFNIIAAVYRKNLLKDDIQKKIMNKEDSFFLSEESNILFGGIPSEYIQFFRELWAGENTGALDEDEKDSIWLAVQQIYANVREWLDIKEKQIGKVEMEILMESSLKQIDNFIVILKNMMKK